MATAKKVKKTWTHSELVEKLAQDIADVLKLRGKTHYLPRPDEQYELSDEVPDAAWRRWANQVYDNNNQMGHILADAEAIIKALGQYTEQGE